MNIRAKQGGSAVVYGIISVLLALGVIGVVYAVQKRANGEQIAPMDIAQVNPLKDNENKESSEQKKSGTTGEAEKQKANEQQDRKEQQAAEEEKAQQQRREAAAQEARQREAEEKRAAEQKQKEEAQTPAAAGSGTSGTPSSPQQMPTTGGPSVLPQTGPADLVFGAFVILVLGYSVIKYSYSQARL